MKKFCNKCKEWKPVEDFYKTTNGGCKICVQAYHKAWKLKKYPPKPKVSLPDGLRRCSKCREIKANSEFYKDANSKTGYQHKCKVCSNIARKLRNQKYLKPKEILPDNHKRCAKCKEVKPFAEFNKVNGKPRSRCRICDNKFKVRNPETVKAYQSRPEVKQRRKGIKDRFYSKLLNNPDRLEKELEYRRAYRKKPEVQARNREHNANFLSKPENQEKARANTIAWRKNNPDQVRYQSQVKRVRKLNAEGSYTLEQWQTLLSFFDCCPKCKKQKVLTVDHIIPLSKGGTNFLDNLQPLCGSCNSGKNNHVIIDYRPRSARLWAFMQVQEACIAS